MNNKNINDKWAPPLAPPQKNSPFKIKNAHKRALATTLGITALERPRIYDVGIVIQNTVFYVWDCFHIYLDINF